MILHIDMDAFYAAVEQRDHPELRGKPVVVGGTPEGRGVVAAASYEARTFGVHSAMPAGRAKRLCPQAIFLPSRIEHYAQVSRQIREIFHRFTPLVEPLSLDEAFLDASGSEPLFGSSIEIGLQIKQAIRDELQLIASVGIAPNKFLAKIASDLEKPDGFVVVEKDRVLEFLSPLPVGRLWGVGRVTGKALDALGIQTIGDVRKLSHDKLRETFGEQGEHFWNLSRGIDNRDVVPDRDAKSISHETTFSEDIDDREALTAWVIELSDQVARRLRHYGLRGRTVQLKVRFSDFRTITRATTLSQATNVSREIWQAAQQMLVSRLPKGDLPVRLLGVGVSGFDQTEQRQGSLFQDDDHEMQTKLDSAADKIREKFGTSSIGRASGLMHGANYRRQATPDDLQGTDKEGEE